MIRALALTATIAGFAAFHHHAAQPTPPQIVAELPPPSFMGCSGWTWMCQRDLDANSPVRSKTERTMP